MAPQLLRINVVTYVTLAIAPHEQHACSRRDYARELFLCIIDNNNYLPRLLCISMCTFTRFTHMRLASYVHTLLLFIIIIISSYCWGDARLAFLMTDQAPAYFGTMLSKRNSHNSVGWLILLFLYKFILENWCLLFLAPTQMIRLFLPHEEWMAL